MNEQRDALTRALIHEVVATAAPAEVFIANSYRPDQDESGKTAKGALGFGAEAAIALSTPILFKFFEQVYDEASREAAHGLVSGLRAYLTRHHSASQSDDDLRQTISAELQRLGVERDDIEQIAHQILSVTQKHDRALDRR